MPRNKIDILCEEAAKHPMICSQIREFVLDIDGIEPETTKFFANNAHMIKTAVTCYCKNHNIAIERIKAVRCVTTVDQILKK